MSNHAYAFQITLKFDRQLISSIADTLVKFQSDMIIITPNIKALGLHKILR